MRCQFIARVLAALTLSLAAVPACGDDDGSSLASPDAQASRAEDAGPQGDDPALTDGGGASGEAAPFECGNDSSGWNRNWQAMECEVMDLINAHRAEGADCAEEGNFEPGDAVEPHAVLTANARMHSQDMLDNNYFDFDDSRDRSISEWARDGYATTGSVRGDISTGPTTPAGVVDGLMASPTDCANLMWPGSQFIGVGHADLTRDAGASMVLHPMWTIISAD